MRTYKARISEGDIIVVDSVNVYLEERTDPGSGLPSWYGAFRLSPDKHLEPGGRYTLTLDDERCGEMFVRSIARSTQSPWQQVEFLGTGPLK